MCRSSSVLWRCAAGAMLVASVAACSGGGDALRTTPATTPTPVVTAAAVTATPFDINQQLSTLDRKLTELDQTLKQIDADLGADEGDPTK